MMLNEAPVNEIVKVSSIQVEDESVSGYLASLGLFKDSELEVLSRDKKGSTIIYLKGSRLALDKDLSRLISVY